MKTHIVSCVLAGIALVASVNYAADTIVSAPPKTPQEEQKFLRVPEGFEVQLVAAEPEIHKPINMAFDDRGRLWVTTTVDYPFPAPEGATPNDLVKILENFADNGKAGKITTYADKLDIPIGVLPLHDDTAIIYSIPNIWRMTHTPGSDHAEKRQVMFGPYEHLDTHGMTGSFTEGFDGWIYAVHGYRNTDTIKAPDGSCITMNSGNTYRFKRDGSHVEYYTHGQVNPFGLTFDRLGNMYTSDCETMPMALMLRGAYYPSFGKPDDGLGFAPNIIDHFYGSTAIAGLCDYVADQFPEAYRDRMYVGNVVTNKINNAKLTPRGSGVHGDDVPDFLVSGDPWFRPTNIKLGPDGALYVADFYNRIIGHYEVDLHHPGRDRTSGRIWRIAYKGTGGNAPKPAPKFDLTKASVAEMIDLLASPNFTVRMLTMNRLADVVGQEAVGPVKAMVAKTSNVDQKVHGLWILFRLGALDGSMIKAAASDSQSVVREHTMRMLGEQANWDSGERELAVAGIHDRDPLVRRTAAEALGRHPAFENVQELLSLMKLSDTDAFINHVAKIALRDHLMQPQISAKLAGEKLDDRDERLVADAVIGAPSPEAAGLLLRHVMKGTDKAEAVTRELKAVARYVPADQVEQLASYVEAKFDKDVDLQRNLFEAVLQGLDERGARPGQAVYAWGSTLAKRLIAKAADATAWTYRPIPGSTDTRNPWGVEIRKSADGDNDSPFLSSRVRNEAFTGIARTQAFTAPTKLSFFMAGHNGPPPETWETKNLVRIRDAKTDEILAFAVPPRNDAARQTTFYLEKYAGRQVYLEVTDGLNGKGYSWLAVGRFDPPVITVPISGPQLLSAVSIIKSLRLNDLAGQVEKVMGSGAADADVRSAAANALGALGGASHVEALGRTVNDPTAPDEVRQAAASVLASVDSPEASKALVEAMRTAPQKLQVALAQALATGRSGADALLDAIEQGKASARLLLDSNVRERLNVVQPKNFDQRLAQLTKGLPAADAQVQKLIDDRAAAFDSSKASAARGKLVFEKNCSICHAIGTQGAHVGPPLDGIGVRGVARLCEDILDPSRNVAADFKQSTFVMSDGNVMAGIPRRQEGQTVVIADSTGKEVTLQKSQISRQVESKLSLMPSNFGEVIAPNDFDDLLAYLLSMKQ
jgi:putative heme-binding domain-containing protein